jgi:hypothetical protein
MADRSTRFALEERDLGTNTNGFTAVCTEFSVKTGLDHPHPLFDYPLQTVFRDFLNRLDTYYNTNAIYQAVTDDSIPEPDNPLSTFASALKEVVEVPEDHQGIAQLAAENTLCAAQDFDDWTGVASTWFWQYFSFYNTDEFWENEDVHPHWESLTTSVDELLADARFSEEDILSAIKWYLYIKHDGGSPVL